MSRKSLVDKIDGLEQRLSKENEHRRREDLSITGMQHRGPSRRPRLPNTGRSRPEALNLPPSMASVMSQQDSETESRLRDLRTRMGNLTIDENTYKSDIKDLDHLGELGNGTCGHVVKMLHKPSQTIIAVKQMRRSGNSEENKRILMDLDIVLRSHCPFIVKCFGCFVTEADVWICMELMASCFDKILKKLGGPVPEEILGMVTVSTVKALSYLKEEHGVIHRDVKPSNILVDSRGSIKLCDFGISGRLVDSKAKTRNAGCAAYMAPERIDPPNPQEPDYDIRADVWSLGISLVELATGLFPYSDCQNDFEVLSRVIHEEPPALPENQSFSSEFRSFVRQCLTKDFEHRPKYNALVQHPFFVRSEASGVRVNEWLQGILPGSEMAPSINTSKQFKLENFTISQPTVKQKVNQFIGYDNDGLHKRDVSQLNDSSSVICDSKSSQQIDRENCLISSHVDRVVLSDNDKSCQESPDASFSESSKISCISVDQNSSINNSTSSKISVQGIPCQKINIEAATNSMENLMFSTPKHTIEDVENTEVTVSPLDKNVYRIQRNIVHTESHSSGVAIIPVSRNNYSHVTGSSPKEYYFPQRERSLSNTMPYERSLPHRYTSAAAPNTKNYVTCSEMRHQQFSGGGPPSLESYMYQPDPQHPVCQPRTYGSPEVQRKQYFSPNRNRPPPTYCEFDRSRQSNDTHHNLVSPPNISQGYSNVGDGRMMSPPCFRPNAPTNYFASSVNTMSRFGPVPNVEHSSIAYNYNPGGSCSQPASLEAYGDTRHPPCVINSKPPEKAYNPGLWSPQPVVRRAAREREERWKNDTQHHPQVASNTSPIVLQRFYHQQNQRRSRRDLRDGSPSHRSVSRDASIGRSPEPPRRAHRDPSTGRTDPQLPMDQQSILERLEKERLERSNQIERERDLHIPERDTTLYPSLRDRERHKHELIQTQPDLIKPQLKYAERETRHTQDCHNSESDNISYGSNFSKMDCSQERLEYRTRNEPLSRSYRERRTDLNGECKNSEDNPNTSNERDNLTSPRERFEQKLQERRINKETYIFPKTRRDNCNGEIQPNCKTQSKDDSSSRLSSSVPHKNGKSYKDKDEQGSSGSDHQSLLSSPASSVSHYTKSAGGKDGHPRISRITGGNPRRIADFDQDVNSPSDKKHEHGHFASSYRVRNSAPQPPPRRGATESWSLPASPLPARPL